MLRDRWGDILAAVREVSKVAWILLGDASVESVEGNTLTLAFASEGNAKAFGGSGRDQVLADVLDRMFGTRPVIRAIVQSGSAHPTAPARPAAPVAPARPAAAAPEPPAERAPATGAASERAAAQREDEPGRAAETPPAPKRPARSRSSAPKTPPKRPDPVLNDDPRSQTDAEEPGSGDRLTGTDLIMRELGGTVIEEIGED